MSSSYPHALSEVSAGVFGVFCAHGFGRVFVTSSEAASKYISDMSAGVSGLFCVHVVDKVSGISSEASKHLFALFLKGDFEGVGFFFIEM